MNETFVEGFEKEAKKDDRPWYKKKRFVLPALGAGLATLHALGTHQPSRGLTAALGGRGSGSAGRAVGGVASKGLKKRSVVSKGGGSKLLAIKKEIMGHMQEAHTMQKSTRKMTPEFMKKVTKTREKFEKLPKHQQAKINKMVRSMVKRKGLM